eukprot:tig00021038_g17558.t1
MLLHALSTEDTEVVGLCVGDVEEEPGNSPSVRIRGVLVQQRTDRRKDRVEVSPEQLARASEEAAQMKGRVVGWYHSHPHITVQASHVDLRTQFNFQRLGESFVGIILSVFDRNAESESGRVQITAFQTETTPPAPAASPAPSPPAPSPPARAPAPPHDSDPPLIDLEDDDGGRDPAPSPPSARPSAMDIDPQPSAPPTPSLPLPYRGHQSGPLSRRDVPVELLPASEGGGYEVLEDGVRLPLSAAQALRLQGVLLEEERSLYREASEGAHPLRALHAAGRYEARIAQLLEHGLVPLVQVLQARLARAEDALQALARPPQPA